MWGVAVSHNPTMATAPVINWTSFEDILAEEANFAPSCQPRHVKFSDMTDRDFTSSTPHKQQREVALPQRPIIQKCPEEIGLHMAACKFRKMGEPKINKLKHGYSSSAGLVFQSWLKDIHVYVEDRRLTQRGVIQLVKDFTAEHSKMKWSLYGTWLPKKISPSKDLIDHLHNAFQFWQDIKWADQWLLWPVSEGQRDWRHLC